MESIASQEAFIHVRMIIGVVTGLSMARLLSGLARFVQHPARPRVYPTHVIWAVFMLLATTNFWWFEFGLRALPIWTFETYFFVITYAAVYFFTCTLLFPDTLDEYRGYEDYFHARQKWFFFLLATIYLMDLADSALKGGAYFVPFGSIYVPRQVGFALLAIGAAFTQNRRVHLGFALAALVGEVLWIGWQYELLT